MVSFLALRDPSDDHNNLLWWIRAQSGPESGIASLLLPENVLDKSNRTTRETYRESSYEYLQKILLFALLLKAAL